MKNIEPIKTKTILKINKYLRGTCDGDPSDEVPVDDEHGIICDKINEIIKRINYLSNHKNSKPSLPQELSVSERE